jgi:hypothetical protein
VSGDPEDVVDLGMSFPASEVTVVVDLPLVSAILALKEEVFLLVSSSKEEGVGSLG